MSARFSINLADVRRTFPQLIEGFGESALSSQISGFNDLLAEGALPEDASAAGIAAALVKHGVRSPHVSLLNLLSLWSSRPTEPEFRQLIVRLFLVEEGLQALKRHNIAPGNYNSMLRDPGGLEQLIAELDAAFTLAAYGKLSAHVDSGRGGASMKNYDIDWSWRSLRLRADVKLFETWSIHRSPEDELSAFLRLLRTDLAHTVHVSLERLPYSESMLIAAAEEVLELYRAAVSGSTPQGIQVSSEGDGVIALRARVPSPGTSVVSGVRQVSVFMGDTFGAGEEPPLTVSRCGVATSDRDVNTVRRCLQSAASQVPVSTTNRELSAIVVGSLNPRDELDVKSALFGTSRVDYATGAAIQEAGFFSDHTEEVDLKHVDAVVFFSQRYVARARHVVVRRTVRIFARPRLDWRRRAMLLLWGWIFGWSRKVSMYQPNV